jgi:class 3 adenylate cyclase
MHLQDDVERFRKSLTLTDQIQTELDRRIFHLKTLYDISKEIYGSVNTGVILRNFLLMTTGNFGMVEGFVAIADANKRELVQFVSLAVQSGKSQVLRERSLEFCLNERFKGTPLYGTAITEKLNFPITLECALPFVVHEGWTGVLGLGEKIIGEPCSENDKELIDTLLFNLAIALKNARSFEEIKQLNTDLQAKNDQLEETLGQLKAALRKVDILESIKANLGKFVPHTVRSLIEKSPNGVMPETREQDISVLFLDIQDYTRICERLNKRELNDVIERHFSVFMDAIYAHNGDVNETAGDGLMVIFQNADRITNALEAVRAALTIREETICASSQCKVLYKPLLVNMGINSGTALVGASRFNSVTGSRWTYTARGSVTNVAARVGAQARDGSILLTRKTADRVRDRFELTALGEIKLKNVSTPVEIFKV